MEKLLVFHYALSVIADTLKYTKCRHAPLLQATRQLIGMSNSFYGKDD